jgi:small Trp-rich protein
MPLTRRRPVVKGVTMWFIVIGVLLIALKLSEIGPVAGWAWWIVLTPFACAFAWWAFADSSGLTKRREMDKLEGKKVERRRKAMEALGIDRTRQDRENAAQRARRAAAARVEGQRSQVREKNEKTIRDSVFDSRHDKE